MVKDRAVLKLIQSSYNGIGSITKHGKCTLKYRVASAQDLAVIINHFDKYPLISQKLADYLLFKQAFYLVKSKKHLTTEGLHKIVALRASINNGLSDELKAAFPNVIPVPRPLVEDQKIKDPNWLAGFASGEGCFRITIKEYTSPMKKYAYLIFKITQHSRDEKLMKNIVDYLGCGNYYSRSSEDKGEFRVAKFFDIESKIIPLFNQYQIEGVKALDFADFKKAAEIMKVKGGLTPTGLEEILKIKEGMNRGRSDVLKTAPNTGGYWPVAKDKHFPEQKASRFLKRTPPSIFVYDVTTLCLLATCVGYERLAGLLGVHVNTARRLVKSGSVYSPSGQDKFILTLENVSSFHPESGWNLERLEDIKASPLSLYIYRERMHQNKYIYFDANLKRNSTTAKRVVHVYNKQKSVLLKTFSSVNEFMKFSKLSGSVTKQLCESENLWLDEYFISYDLIPGADNSLASVGEFRPKLRERTTSIPVYTYSADGTTFIKRYSSLRECVKDLEGNRNFNTKTLMLRIEHKELYHGLRVSYKPLFEHSI